MIIIAGLGNPGKDYAGTRHNAGFMTIDALASKYGIDVGEKKHKAIIGKGAIEGHKVILAKPQTFMNNSGLTVSEALSWYKIEPKDMLLLVDDIDQAIDKCAVGWTRSRMGKCELAALRLGIYEMLYDDDIPEGVAMDEAVEIAKTYGDNTSGAFVNAILTKVMENS